jgi:predicted Zn-dependent peptidase
MWANRHKPKNAATVEERLGTLPALAIGYHAPKRRSPDWYAAALLDQALHGGRAGRVYRRLVLEKQVAVDTQGGIHYPLGDVLDYNGPVLMVTRILHKPEFTSDATLAGFDALIRDAQEKGIGADELEQVKVKFRSDYYSTLEGGMGGYMPRFGLMHYLACFTLFDGDPHLVNTAFDSFLAVTPAEVQRVAQKILVPTNRAIVFRQPVAKGGA